MDCLTISNSTIKPPKQYRNLRLPREQLICKRFSYSNPSSIPKTITVKPESEFMKVKNPTISIPPYSSEFIQLRLFFPRTAPREVLLGLRIEEEGLMEEEIRLCITVL